MGCTVSKEAVDTAIDRIDPSAKKEPGIIIADTNAQQLAIMQQQMMQQAALDQQMMQLQYVAMQQQAEQQQLMGGGQQSTGQHDDEERKKNEALQKELQETKDKLAQSEQDKLKKELEDTQKKLEQVEADKNKPVVVIQQPDVAQPIKPVAQVDNQEGWFCLHYASLEGGSDMKATTPGITSYEQAVQKVLTFPRGSSNIIYTWFKPSGSIQHKPSSLGYSSGGKWSDEYGGEHQTACFLWGKNTGIHSQGRTLIVIEGVYPKAGNGPGFGGINSVEAALKKIISFNSDTATSYALYQPNDTIYEKNPSKRAGVWMDSQDGFWFVWVDKIIGFDGTSRPAGS